MKEKKRTGSVPDGKGKADKEVVPAGDAVPTQSHAKPKELKGTAKWRAGQLEGKDKTQAGQNGAKVPDVKNDFWHKVRPAPE